MDSETVDTTDLLHRHISKKTMRVEVAAESRMIALKKCDFMGVQIHIQRSRYLQPDFVSSSDRHHREHMFFKNANIFLHEADE